MPKSLTVAAMLSGLSYYNCWSTPMITAGTGREHIPFPVFLPLVLL